MDRKAISVVLGIKPLRDGEARAWQYGDRRAEKFGGYADIEMSADGKVFTVKAARTRGYERLEAFLQAELHEGRYVISCLDCAAREVDVHNPKELSKGLKTLKQWLHAIHEMMVAERFQRQYRRDVPKFGAIVKDYRTKAANIVRLR